MSVQKKQAIHELRIVGGMANSGLMSPCEDWQPPLVLPADWRREPNFGPAAHYESGGGMRVLITKEMHEDEKVRVWVHLSVSRPTRLPSWEDLKQVKDLFIGRDKMAFQALPPASEYVNVHQNCLHLWYCLDGNPLPSFGSEAHR